MKVILLRLINSCVVLFPPCIYKVSGGGGFCLLASPSVLLLFYTKGDDNAYR